MSSDDPALIQPADGETRLGGAAAERVKSRIFLAGDKTIDQVLMRLPPRGGVQHSETDRYWRYILWDADEGGVELTRKTLIHLGFEPIPARWPAEKEILKSLVEISPLKRKNGKWLFDDRPPIKPAVINPKTEEAYFQARISRYQGYFRTASAAASASDGGNLADPEPCALAVINDAGGNTRASAIALEKVTTADALIVHKMHMPLSLSSELATEIKNLTGRCRMLILTAADLRSSGQRLRSHLSWSATFEDLGRAVEDRNSFLNRAIAAYEAAVLIFDVEGVVQFQKVDDTVAMCAVFDAARVEGDIAHELPGELYGKTNAFTCALVHAMRDWRGGVADEGHLRAALAAAQHSSRSAIRLDRLSGDAELQLPMPTPDSKEVTETAKTLKAVKSCKFSARDTVELIPGHHREDDLLKLAKDIVIDYKNSIAKIPSARFGEFVTVDPSEMESFRTIRRIINQYLENTKREKPLSIAVFGPPGAGKSYGIKQLVDGDETPIYEYNMSEASHEALPGYFHELRDSALRGKTPLCFFDEFDSRNRELVASFLAPMQDGTFREGSRVHPIGRAILVFAGGTANKAKEFAEASTDADRLVLKSLKVPDFVSRLSGVIDIRGPNREDKDDAAFVLRRAVLLRSLLERFASQIIVDQNGEANIDDDVLTAFLQTEKYRFGARSMEKLIIYSALRKDAARFVASDLPEKHLLELHLENPNNFLI